MNLYGIPNCDKVRAARKWLDERGLAYDFVNVRETPPDERVLDRWLEQLGGEQLINRRSTTWKALDDAERARADSAPARLLRENPTLIKRPVLESGQRLLCGFTPAAYAEALAERCE